MNRRKSKLANNSAALTQLKRQRRITKTLLSIVICTFITSVIPKIGIMYGHVTKKEVKAFAAIIPYLGIVACSNSGINIILYGLINGEMRGMFVRTLLCRSSTETNRVAPSQGVSTHTNKPQTQAQQISVATKN